MTHNVFDTIETTEHTVACSGDGGALGHPKVYLHLDAETHSVTCPYCSRTYVLRHEKAGKVA